MRIPAPIVVIALLAVPAAAGDGFELHLDALPIARAAEPDAGVQPADGRLSLDAERSIGGAASLELIYRTATVPRTDREYRLALWNSPMARLHYDRATAESMLGREGLVGGGRLAGLGMATTALGDGDPTGLELLIRSEAWTSLPLGTKVEAGLQASFVAALLYFMADSAN